MNGKYDIEQKYKKVLKAFDSRAQRLFSEHAHCTEGCPPWSIPGWHVDGFNGYRALDFRFLLTLIKRDKKD